jgi:glycosyltransferase 2 family protein
VNKYLRVAKNYLRLAITGLLMGWIVWSTKWAEVFQAFVDLDVSLWLAAVGLLVVAQMVSAVRWQIFARRLGMERTFWQLTRFYLIGMYFNLALPTSVGGDVVRIWYLNANSGQTLRATAAVLLDRINGLIVLVAVACVAVLHVPPEIPAWVLRSVFGIAAAGVCGVVTLAAIIHWGRLPENRKQQFAVMWEVVRHPSDLFATTALSLVVQLASAAIVWLVGQGLNVDIPFSYYAVFVPMVSLLTLLPVSVNGMGVREEACALFLAPLGVGKSIAVK